MNIDERLLPVTLSEEPSVYVKQNRLLKLTTIIMLIMWQLVACMQSLLLIFHEGDILHKQSPCVGAYFKFLQVFFTPFHTNYR